MVMTELVPNAVQRIVGEGAGGKAGNAGECTMWGWQLGQRGRTKRGALRRLPAGWVEHAIDGEGNCLFRAIAHQLQINGVTDSLDEVYTDEMLRELADSCVGRNSIRLRVKMSDSYKFNLIRQTSYVDHGAIAALADALEVNVVVYGAPGGHVAINAHGIVGSTEEGFRTLRILYNNDHNHYNSVVRIHEANPQSTAETAADSASSKVGLKRTYEERERTANTHVSTQPPRERTAKVLRDEELPCALKIFEEKYRSMRDNEFDMLVRLWPNNNVPAVVRKSDVSGRPALIICPAADKVLPLKHGVRTNRTDFVKLLHALKNAHDLGICHRDVKPDDIFKDEND
eukprot:scaffold1439_cov179-Ochromonas_danica.AAC.3